MLTKKKPNIKDVKFFRKKNQFWYGWKDQFHDFCEESVFKKHIDIFRDVMNAQCQIFSDDTFYEHFNIFLNELHIEAEAHMAPQHLLKQRDTGGTNEMTNSYMTTRRQTPNPHMAGQGFKFDSDLLSDSQILGSIDMDSNDKRRSQRSQPSKLTSQAQQNHGGVFAELGFEPPKK